MHVVDGQKSIALLASKEEVPVTGRIVIYLLHLLRYVLEACKHILADGPVLLCDLLHKVGGYKALDDQRGLSSPAHLKACDQKIVGKKCRYLVSCKKLVLTLLAVLRDCDTKPVRIRVRTQYDICLDPLSKLYRLAHSLCTLRIWKLHSREASIGKLLLFYNFDIDAEVCFADLHWSLLMRLAGKKVTFTDIPKFPSVKRDLALLLGKQITFAQVEKTAFEAEKKLIKEVTLFDVYEGKNLPEGKKSYAISLLLEDETKTLNDKQIEHIMSRVITNLQNKLGASLR